jgi:cytochrome c-type biogenesis protein
VLDNLGLLTVFFGGVLSFLSPCVLPLVPFYLSYIVGNGINTSRISTLKQAFYFVIGLGLVFVLLGATASLAGQILGEYKSWLGRISGVVILFFGLHFLGILRIPLLYRSTQYGTSASGGAFLLGVTFAFGWTPCIGPVLGSVLLYATQEDTVWHGMRLLSIYALGLGTPFILAALFVVPFHAFLKKAKPWVRRIEIITGVALVIMGILLIFNIFETLAYSLLEFAPWMASLG